LIIDVDFIMPAFIGILENILFQMGNVLFPTLQSIFYIN